MARKKTELNLQAELPEVRSTDFNLFYKPQEAPIDDSVTNFAKSLDNFINGAGTGLVLSKELKDKQLNEAEAIEQFNKNRKGFSDAVNSGDIPKEANPYFIEKYKELTLNKKAQEFKSKVYQEYAKKNVLDNPDPNGFDKFYNDELKLFLQENDLGAYDAITLEKGFFTETSKTRNGLFNTHVQSQMSKIGEDYKFNFKENVQGKFDKNKTNEEIGADISGFVQDAVTNGLSKSSAQKYLLESLKEYAETTQDLEFAERLLRDLPNYLKLGTDSLGNVKGLQNDFDEIKGKIDDRIINEETDRATQLKAKETIESFEATNFADEFETYLEAKEDPRFKEFPFSVQDKVFNEFQKRKQGFSSQTDPRVDEEVQKLLKESDYDGALKLLQKNIPNVSSNYYTRKKEEIQDFQFTEKDGLLANDYYIFFKDKVSDIAEVATRSGKFGTETISPFQADKFEASLRKWLKANPLSNYSNAQEREKAFNKEVKEQFEIIKDLSLNSGLNYSDGNITVDGNDTTPTIEDGKQNTIKANKEDLQSSVPTNSGTRNRKNRRNTSPEDPELTMDMSNVAIIPKGLSGTQLRKFKRDNPNAMTQEEYDRIVEKQTSNQIAKVGGSN